MRDGLFRINKWDGLSEANTIRDGLFESNTIKGGLYKANAVREVYVF